MLSWSLRKGAWVLEASQGCNAASKQSTWPLDPSCEEDQLCEIQAMAHCVHVGVFLIVNKMPVSIAESVCTGPIDF